MKPITFIAGGYNKSGTTFLQQLLDQHPEISCSPEHHLKKLTLMLRRQIDEYWATIKLFDDRTARQGLRLNRNRLYSDILTSAIRGIFNAEMNSEITACGISDNWAYEIYPITEKIVPDLRYLYIIRDPREVAVSLFYHVKRTEPNRIKTTTIDDYAKNFGRKWADHIQRITEQKKRNPNRVLLLNYENLISNKREAEVSKAFNLLEVNDSPQIIKNIFENLDRSLEKEKFKNAFYRSAKKKTWDQELKRETIEEIHKNASIGMKLSGYD
jgi:hypothetical protein